MEFSKPKALHIFVSAEVHQAIKVLAAQKCITQAKLVEQLVKNEAAK